MNESSSNIAEGLISSVQRFGSTESRNGGWSRDLHAPYTNKKSNQGPGPGAYGEKRTSFRTKIQKKLTDEVIGFGATDTRWEKRERERLFFIFFISVFNVISI